MDDLKKTNRNRAPLLCLIKLCTSFQSHWWIQTGVTTRERSIRVKIGNSCAMWLEIWWMTLKNSNWSYSPEMPNFGQNRMTLKNNRAHALCYFKLCASFRSHRWIETGVMVRRRLNWFLTSATLTFDLWPWPFAWASHLSLVITPENFMMIRWWEHGEKGVTGRGTDVQTDTFEISKIWSLG